MNLDFYTILIALHPRSLRLDSSLDSSNTKTNSIQCRDGCLLLREQHSFVLLVWQTREILIFQLFSLIFGAL